MFTCNMCNCKLYLSPDICNVENCKECKRQNNVSIKTKKTLVTIFIIAISVMAMATEKPETNVQSLNADQVLVTVQSLIAVDLEVSILDETGSTVYYKISKKPFTRYHKIFDVANLRNGDYSLELKMDNLVSEREITVTNNKIYVGKYEEYAAPYFAVNGDNLIITHLNQDKERFKMLIHGENGTVYEAFLKNKIAVNAGFDLSKLEAGNYSVVLSSRNHEFNYSFEK